MLKVLAAGSWQPAGVNGGASAYNTLEQTTKSIANAGRDRKFRSVYSRLPRGWPTQTAADATQARETKKRR